MEQLDSDIFTCVLLPFLSKKCRSNTKSINKYWNTHIPDIEWDASMYKIKIVFDPSLSSPYDQRVCITATTSTTLANGLDRIHFTQDITPACPIRSLPKKLCEHKNVNVCITYNDIDIDGRNNLLVSRAISLCLCILHKLQNITKLTLISPPISSKWDSLGSLVLRDGRSIEINARTCVRTYTHVHSPICFIRTDAIYLLRSNRWLLRIVNCGFPYTRPNSASMREAWDYLLSRALSGNTTF